MNKNLNMIQARLTIYEATTGFNKFYFDTKKSLQEYINNSNFNIPETKKIEYLGNIEGCPDVIRLTDQEGSVRICTPALEGCGVYSEERSTSEAKVIWEFKRESLKSICTALKERKIELEDDLYAKEEAHIREITELLSSSRQYIKTGTKQSA